MTSVANANELTNQRRELRSVIDGLHAPGRDRAEEQLANPVADVAGMQLELDLWPGNSRHETAPSTTTSRSC
jgi:hypothetical protein